MNIKITDGSNADGLQLVIDNSKIICDTINTGTSIYVKGLLVKSSAKGQEFELNVEEIKVLGEANPESTINYQSKKI